MLRFYRDTFKENDRIKISKKSLNIGNDIWNNWKNILKEYDDQDCVRCLVPVTNASGEIIAYGYQDSEADRELRMLKELKKNGSALQFTDVFPECKEVVIYGCNELAFLFAEYLETLGVHVSFNGELWKYFCFRFEYEADLINRGRGKKLVLYAEGSLNFENDLYEIMRRSVSSEFECIDKIYESNVLAGKIEDAIGSFDELIDRLKDEKEIVIIGDDRDAQDVYDLLCEQGIDICCFAVKEKTQEELLGKKLMSIFDVMRCFQNPVFLNCKDRYGALGNEQTEYFDYRGYERNRQFYYVRDYIDIKTTNLVHILRGKSVLLTGDRRLCQLLSDYLKLIEDGEVNIKFIGLGEKVSLEKGNISCLVIPDYYNNDRESRRNLLDEELRDMGFSEYTEYFICSRSFVLIELYLKRGSQKYSLPELTPKGILLGRIPGWSGNYFFRGIMDGHPEVLMIPTYCDFNVNLFYYCIRLAGIDSNNILPAFWEMYEEEAYSAERDFVNKERFNRRVERILTLRECFTSQELFVIFHIAFMEMLTNEQISDINKMVIYWEPHFLSRNEFPFFAVWLEDKNVNGQTIVLRRNNIVRTGSACARSGQNRIIRNPLKTMFLDESVWDGVNIQYHYWNEYVMRFEDIKLKPREKLMEICERLGIAWSDCMLQTTCVDKPLEYRGSVDFDLKPVFNRYEEYLSEFDRFRISIASGLYQKKYGFPYESCLKFSRRELQDLFMKPFLFDEKYGNEDKNKYVEIYEWIRWQLWKIRKHMILDDISPKFGSIEFAQTGRDCMAKYEQREIEKTIEYIKAHDKLILYGIGKDCRGLLKHIDENTKNRFLYSDKMAEKHSCIFQGKNVLLPEKLCNVYEDYNILVTSSFYRRNIEYEFEKMGIASSRVFYNKAEFKEEAE